MPPLEQSMLTLFKRRTSSILVVPKKGYLIQIIIGALIVFISLFFPLFTVTYSPPGGSALVYGKHISAFVEIIGGWQFADAAPYFKLLPAMLFLFGLAIVGFLRLWFSPNRAGKTIDTVGNALAPFLNTKITGSVLDYIHAFMHIIIVLGWLLILFLAIIENTPVMPLNGETGILPSFQIDPFSTAGAAQSAFNAANPPTLHLSIAVNLGYYLLLAGIVIGGLAVFKKIIILVLVLSVLLPILYAVDRTFFIQVTQVLI
jgi:hypothetical protein